MWGGCGGMHSKRMRTGGGPEKEVVVKEHVRSWRRKMQGTVGSDRCGGGTAVSTDLSAWRLISRFSFCPSRGFQRKSHSGGSVLTTVPAAPTIPDCHWTVTHEVTGAMSVHFSFWPGASVEVGGESANVITPPTECHTTDPPTESRVLRGSK